MTPEQFKIIRKEMKLTQKQMAAWLYTNERRIRAWEKGENPMPGSVRRCFELAGQAIYMNIKIGDKVFMPDGRVLTITQFANTKD